ncbi:dystrophin isoform X2 [Nilaparvata lugens]|uniref:dystrophin isoform X2 n=1 Tax=Nilaparvata lugens TaxID=108931 RepID=UPI00193D5040|nr:dystrophin isoform X2 [Nilaparvata lugens]
MEEDSSRAPWENVDSRSEASYYVSKRDMMPSYNSKFSVIQDALNECNSIKYAAYRTAAKMCVLQRALGMEHVRLSVIAGVFQKHGYQATENALLLDCTELDALLSDVFFAASKETRQSLDLEYLTEMTVHFLISSFDKDHKGSIQVLSAKIALATLCSSRLQEKYDYFFTQLADHNNCLNKRKLSLLVENFVSMTDYLCESLSFSSNLISSTISSCFEQESHGPLGISEEMFMKWVLKEPQLLVWFSTFYRLRAAEKVSHSVRCAVCRMYPIRGLRYRCLHCISYDQCQTCFFHGCVSKRHKLKHPMQEYCWQTNSKDATLSFLKALMNRFCGNSSRLQYLPAQPSDSAASTPTLNSRTVVDAAEAEEQMEEAEVDDGGGGVVEPQQELQSIISQLEAETKQLDVEIERLRGAGRADVGHNLHEHRMLLGAQIRRLKILKSHLQSMGPRYMQSTPKHNAHFAVYRTPGFSPIDNQPADLASLVDNSGQGSVTLDEPSTWIGGKPTRVEQHLNNISDWLKVRTHNYLRPATTDDDHRSLIAATGEQLEINELHHGLDNILDKLQKMLASNFSLAESSNGQECQELADVKMKSSADLRHSQGTGDADAPYKLACHN